MNNNDKILITQPSLPDLKDFIPYLEEIWESKWITNNGRFHQEFEKKLAEHLGVKYISLFVNGTLALMTAIQALGLKGEVITTPYSFVATAHSLIWNKITPVFVDVDKYGNLDPGKIEAAITDKTTGILPVHVYGNPCQHHRIIEIVDKHNLKLLYDAAHAFGVEENGKSILNYGDLSILSFHATKVFNTIEGGAIISHTAEKKKHIDHLKNFGFEDEITVIEAGINAKMNELQAAYGLLQLNTINSNIDKRQYLANLYRIMLKEIKGITFLNDIENVKHNYSYFPIFIDNTYPITRDELYIKLKENGIYSRRYFYPLISEFPEYKSLDSAKTNNLQDALKKSNQVICLPIYPELELKIVHQIVEIILNL
jgi:dTDP-4-amino-4,6-dideoxygalactose transaminase